MKAKRIVKEKKNIIQKHCGLSFLAINEVCFVDWLPLRSLRMVFVCERLIVELNEKDYHWATACEGW